MRLSLTISCLICSATVFSQDIKSLEYKTQYAGKRVRSRDCYQVRFNGITPVDTIKLGSEEFDNQGRIIRYLEFSAKGKQLAEYHYSYSQNNRINRITMSHAYAGWQEIEMTLRFDASGKIVAREIPNPIQGLWTYETFEYDRNGLLVLSEQWYDVHGQLQPVTRKEFSSPMEKMENSLSFIYDQNDLLIVEQTYINGRSDKSINYNYSFY